MVGFLTKSLFKPILIDIKSTAELKNENDRISYKELFKPILIDQKLTAESKIENSTLYVDYSHLHNP